MDRLVANRKANWEEACALIELPNESPQEAAREAALRGGQELLNSL
jgi:hypothetical protein